VGRPNAAVYIPTVRRSPPFRLLALVLALLGSLSAPALATAHGVAHDHVAREHHQAADHHEADHHGADDQGAGDREADRHERAARAFDGPSSDEHRHDHASVDSAPGPRDLSRLHLAPAALPPIPPSFADLSSVISAGGAVAAIPALLARPGPDGGPPPRLRAPPAR
jgi:hypothetical protein